MHSGAYWLIGMQHLALQRSVLWADLSANDSDVDGPSAGGVDAEGTDVETDVHKYELKKAEAQSEMPGRQRRPASTSARFVVRV